MRRHPLPARLEIAWKQRFRSMAAVAAWLSAIAIFCTGFGSPRLVDRDIFPTASLGTNQLATFANARQIPELTSQATLLYDVDADQILLAQNENNPLPVASLTKLMTALLVLETAAQQDGLLNAEVTIRSEDLVGGATMGLLTGERRTISDLLYGLLIPSGNDAATAVARYIGGLQENGLSNGTPQSSQSTAQNDPVAIFVARMNQRAAEMGLGQTNFANPHGIDEDGHLSSASDLLVLTKVLLNYDLFRQIIQLEEVVIGDRTLVNTNQLLGSFPGVDGIKTGTTPASGQSLIASITRNDHQVIMIILGSRSRYDEARELYRFYEENFIWSDNLTYSNQLLNRIHHEAGQLWYMTPEGETPTKLLSAPNAVAISTFRHIQLPAPTQIWFRGMRIGVVEWRIGNQLIGTQSLILR